MLDARRGGAPTKYKPEYVAVASEMTSGGSADYEIAQTLGITRSTLYLWKSKHPEFSDAIAGARAIPIARVERSLYERAIGYSFDATKIVVVGDQVTAVHYVEHIPPDPHAAKLWLMNVDPMRWRDRHEIAVESKDERTERELTDEEIYARLAQLEDERKKLAAIDVESVVVSPSKELVPVK